MANRYWVGGTAAWDGTAGTKWATTSGGGGGAAAPTAADDVFFDAASGAAVVTLVSTGSVARSVNCTGFTGTLTHSASTTLTLGDGTSGGGNVALLLVAGMTYTLGNAITSAISFVSTSTTQQTIATGGKTLGNWTINGAGSSYLLSDANTVGVTATVTLTAGTLNTNGQTCNWGFFNSANTNTRTLTMGSSSITCTGAGTSWSISTNTNITMTANTATITLSGANPTLSVGTNLNFNGTSIVLSGTGAGVVANSFTCANLTRICTAARTNSLQFNGGNTTITDTLTVNGHSSLNRLMVQSLTVGTPVVVNAAVISTSNADFRDITAAGASIPWTGTSLGDALGNSNITFTASSTRYWVNGTGNWSSTSSWSTSSGGASGASVPLPQDDVIIDNNSGSSFTFTLDMPRIGRNITMSTTNPCSYLSAGLTQTIYGSLIMPASLTTTWGNTVTFNGRGSHTIMSNGKTFGFGVVISAPNNSYTLQDALVTNGTLTLNAGSFITNGYSVTASTFTGSAVTNGTITLDMGSSIFTLTATTASTIFSMGTGTVTNSTESTIVVANASANTRTFTGTSQAFGTVTYTVDNSPGYLTFTGNNTFTTLNVDAGKVLNFTAGTTNTFTDFNVSGSPNGYLYSPGVTSNAVTSPHLAAHSWAATSTAEFIYDIAVANWSAITGTILCKESSDPGRYWKFGSIGGAPNVSWYPTGSLASVLVAQATTTVPFTANQRGKIKIVMLLDNGSGNRVVQFYTSTDYDIDTDTGTWTQLGTDVTGAVSNIGGTGSVTMNYGSLTSTLSNLIGSMYRMRLKVDSNVVFDANFATKAVGANTFTESSPNAATVTITGELIRAGDGRVTIISSSGGSAATLSKSNGVVSSNYLSVRDSTATGGAAWYAGTNSTNVSGNSGWLFTSPNFAGWFDIL